MSTSPGRRSARPYPIEGSLLRASGDIDVWLLVPGGRVKVASIAAFEEAGLSWDAVEEVPEADLNRIPPFPRDGTLIQEQGSDTLYIVQRGLRMSFRRSEDIKTYGLTNAPMIQVPRGSLDPLPHVGFFPKPYVMIHSSVGRLLLRLRPRSMSSGRWLAAAVGAGLVGLAIERIA